MTSERFVSQLPKEQSDSISRQYNTNREKTKSVSEFPMTGSAYTLETLESMLKEAREELNLIEKRCEETRSLSSNDESNKAGYECLEEEVSPKNIENVSEMDPEDFFDNFEQIFSISYTPDHHYSQRDVCNPRRDLRRDFAYELGNKQSNNDINTRKEKNSPNYTTRRTQDTKPEYAYKSYLASIQGLGKKRTVSTRADADNSTSGNVKAKLEAESYLRSKINRKPSDQDLNRLKSQENSFNIDSYSNNGIKNSSKANKDAFKSSLLDKLEDIKAFDRTSSIQQDLKDYESRLSKDILQDITNYRPKGNSYANQERYNLYRLSGQAQPPREYYNLKQKTEFSSLGHQASHFTHQIETRLHKETMGYLKDNYTRQEISNQENVKVNRVGNDEATYLGRREVKGVIRKTKDVPAKKIGESFQQANPKFRTLEY